MKRVWRVKLPNQAVFTVVADAFYIDSHGFLILYDFDVTVKDGPTPGIRKVEAYGSGKWSRVHWSGWRNESK